MGGGKKGGGGEIPVTNYYASIHFGICHGVIDRINKIFFNGKEGWNGIRTRPVSKPFTNKTYDRDAWLIVNTSATPGPGAPNAYTDRLDLTGGYRADWQSVMAGGYVVWSDINGAHYRKIISVARVDLGPVEDSNTGARRTGMRVQFGAGDSSQGFPAMGFWVNEPGEWRWSKSPITVYAKDEWLAPGETPPPPPPPPPIVDHQMTLDIWYASEIFGGKKKEGGVGGLCHVMMGDKTQVVPSDLAALVGRTPQTMPAYRGVANAWFYGPFYWGTNNNRLPDVWINVTRTPIGLDPAIAMIGPDANPAHIIYEAMTNVDWGMGASMAAFNTPGWNAVAQVLFDEQFGISMMWTDQMDIEKFIGEVLDHIEGSMFINPRTGLFELKLIRADYDETTLRTLTPDNANLMNFQRKAWGETINEIVVTYKNPANEEEASFTLQDNANIAMQGSIVTDNRNYYGIRSASLAARVAERDLRAASAPLCSCDVEVLRSAWDLLPGDVIKITWPEYGLVNLVMRVGPVDYGKPGEPRIRASLVEDVFFMPDESYFVPPETEWIDPRETAVPIPITKVISIPFYYLVQRFPVNEENTQQHQYPESIAGVLGSTYQEDAQSFTLATMAPDAVGNMAFRAIGVKDLAGYSLLDTATALEAKSYFKFHEPTPKGGPTVGGFGIISDEDDFFAEVVAFESYDETLGWLVWRGALDTVPRIWPANTPIRFIDNNLSFLDNTIRADMETVEYKLLTTTSLNTLEMSDAPEVTGLLNGRPHYPFRPANVRLNALLWGAALVDGTEGIHLTWALRSRLQETSVIMLWTEESVIPEDGQTTTVTFFDHEGEVIQKLTGLTGTTASLDFSMIPGPSVEYRVESERDGLASLQYVDHEFDVCGWGMNYGNYYGGKP